jgi:DNA-binding NarL/FixJ family response regulator
MGESRKTLAALLTRREVQVLKGVAQGLSEREIALRLLIFEPAVREHIRSACEKLRVQARRQPRGHVEHLDQPDQGLADVFGRGQAS